MSSQILKINIDYSELIASLEDKVNGLVQIATPRNQEHLAKAIFTISANEFTVKMSKMALASPKSLHHVYEWGQLGNINKRLFEIRRAQVGGGNLYVSAYFLPSKTRVPIPEELTLKGKNSRSVRSRYVFVNKAAVMESGRPTRPFSATRAKALVFSDRYGGLIFIRRPRTVVIKNPGGRYTTGSFTRKFATWFENPENINMAIRRSGFNKALEVGIAEALQSTNTKAAAVVNKTIAEVSARYSMGKVIV